MGTPEFAVPSLAALLAAGHDVIAVVTAPDKPAGRGLKLQESDVKRFALENSLKILQPEKLRDPEFLKELQLLKADLQVVVAFRMLPEVVWNMPPLGTINVHGSLLPQYRGAAPINWAIINGEKETGVTTFRLKHEIDTGNILLQQSLKIGEKETAGELYTRMKVAGAQLLMNTLEGIAEKNLAAKAQPDISGESLRHAPKIHTETCEIDWSKRGQEIYNLIRGLSPYPAAYTFLNGKKLKIYQASLVDQKAEISPGSYSTDNRSFLHFAAADSTIALEEIQLEGKKKMKIEDFLRGWRS